MLSSNDMPPMWSRKASVTTPLPSYIAGQIADVPLMASWKVVLELSAEVRISGAEYVLDSGGCTINGLSDGLSAVLIG
jgi:hypothetical protein